MGRQYPAEDIQEGGGSVLVPKGAYRVGVRLDETLTKGANKLMLKLSARIKEPSEFAGLMLYENFVIGNDQDPDASDPTTWKTSMGASRFTQLRNACGVAGTGDLDADLEAVNEDHEVMVLNEPQLQSTPNPRTGEKEVQNRLVSFFPIADTGAAPAAAPKKALAAAKAPTPAKATAPAPAPKAKAAKEPTLSCQVCKEEIPRSGFLAHVDTHGENEE